MKTILILSIISALALCVGCDSRSHRSGNSKYTSKSVSTNGKIKYTHREPAFHYEVRSNAKIDIDEATIQSLKRGQSIELQVTEGTKTIRYRMSKGSNQQWVRSTGKALSETDQERIRRVLEKIETMEGG